MDEDEWDRFAYWNDIEYDSDGYHDVDHDRMKKKRNTAMQHQTGTLKRKAAATNRTPTKRRKGGAGKAHVVAHDAHISTDSPVVWRFKEDETGVPAQKDQVNTFALLKDWRARFPERKTGDNSVKDAASPMEASQPENAEEGLDIDSNILRAALQANLSKLTGASSGDSQESMLLDYVSRMLSGGGSADDIAGELADALFAKDGDSTEDNGDAEGGGDFGQWVLGRAEAQAGGGAPVGVVGEPSPANSAEEGSGDARVDDQRTLPVSPLPAVPADRRPPTPGSTQTRSSVDTPKNKGSVQKVEEAPEPKASAPSAVRGRKRKADDENGSTSNTAPSKRAATRSFDAPTASSKAKATATDAKTTSKRSTRASSKRS